jgi:hypothetical protein
VPEDKTPLPITRGALREKELRIAEVAGREIAKVAPT